MNDFTFYLPKPLFQELSIMLSPQLSSLLGKVNVSEEAFRFYVSLCDIERRRWEDAAYQQQVVNASPQTILRMLRQMSEVLADCQRNRADMCAEKWQAKTMTTCLIFLVAYHKTKSSRLEGEIFQRIVNRLHLLEERFFAQADAPAPEVC